MAENVSPIDVHCMASPLTRERTIRSVLSISLCLSNYVLAHITLCGEMVPLLYAFRHGRRDMLKGLPASSDWHLSQGNRGSQMVNLQRYRLYTVLEAVASKTCLLAWEISADDIKLHIVCTWGSLPR